MEQKDLELIEANRKSNYELARLYDEHVKLDKQVADLESKNIMTPEERTELVVLKKMKLDGRDKMEAILQTLR